VASRCLQRLPFMASINRPTSRSVRCSRDRYSALGLRLGNLAGADCTVNFSVSGAPKVRCAVAAISMSSGWPTVHLKRHLFVVVPTIICCYYGRDLANPFHVNSLF
jgi:hypothetical protein